MRKLYGIILVLMVLLLTGCGGEIVADLYVQDLQEIVEDVDNQLFTTTTIALETMGEEYNAELIEIITQSFRDARNFRNQSRDFSSYLLADVKIPVLNYDDLSDLSDHLLGIIVLEDEDDSLTFGLGLNADKFNELSAYFEEEWFQSLSITDFSLSLKLINDTRETILVGVQGVYANQTPVVDLEWFELERRDTLELRLSDVMRDYVFENGVLFFGVL